MEIQENRCPDFLKNAGIIFYLSGSLLYFFHSDLSRWDHNPCSTHVTCSNAKLSVCRKASKLFGLMPDECENWPTRRGFPSVNPPTSLLNSFNSIMLLVQSCQPVPSSAKECFNIILPAENLPSRRFSPLPSLLVLIFPT